MPTHQKAMIDACESGNPARLQQLFQGHNVKQGGPEVLPKDLTEPGPPATYEMIYAAVAHRHLPVVKFLLSTYPTIDLWCESIIDTVIVNSDLEIFQLLHAHYPRIIDFEYSPLQNALGRACREPDTTLAHYLLDNGADPNFSHLTTFSCSIQLSKPDGLLIKLVQKGSRVSDLDVKMLIDRQGLDVLTYMLGRRGVNRRRWKPRDMLQQAHESGNKEIIALVERYISEEKREDRRRRKWWQVWGWVQIRWYPKAYWAKTSRRRISRAKSEL